MITAKSYFSGAGGMDLGMIEAGINILESMADTETNQLLQKKMEKHLRVLHTMQKTEALDL
ncbi:hypothetical protein [Enterococcus gallinarum]|uniref:hypothetical protein n=1 Tax=Enterococcus gallinarum TaxID=1353 RepID=UPI00214C4C9C|nr:hypothetical protein [Enterococcus gallinarum]MCR1929419.1 hypothetical protein [Enterococcus gallinarum]MCR1932289.1 hypothetical protein [Enterococcus gallinarum]